MRLFNNINDTVSPYMQAPEGPVVRMTAASFIKHYKDNLLQWQRVVNLLNEALKHGLLITQEIEYSKYIQDMTEWKEWAKTINRASRRRYIQHYKHQLRWIFSSTETRIRKYKDRCSQVWWRGSKGFVDCWGVFNAHNLENEVDYYYKLLAQFASADGKGPMTFLKMPDQSSETSHYTFAKRYADYAYGHEYYDLAALLGVAQSRPAGMMLYIPLRLVSAVVEDFQPTLDRMTKSISKIDEYLISIGRGDKLFSGQLHPTAENFSLQSTPYE